MALREIHKEGDDILRKKSRSVEKIDKKILDLLDDMAQTLYHEKGAGLAAPQVGILKRVVVIDVGEGLIELINPKIVSSSGSDIEAEGCLSIPGVWGKVDRPSVVEVTALDREGKERFYKGEGYLARAFCHEIDHLEGILFTDKVISYIDPKELS